MSLVINLGGLNFDELQHRLDEAVPDALDRGIEHLRGVAVERTPVETGHLAGSATPSVDGDEASITYPGPYARYQHERLDLHHEHGRAKYLESTLADEGQNALGIVARGLREAL